jgi:hypothetical protein
MTCPHCGSRFGIVAEKWVVASVICLDCAGISVLAAGELRKATDEEAEELKGIPAWNQFIGPAQAVILRFKRARNARNN